MFSSVVFLKLNSNCKRWNQNTRSEYLAKRRLNCIKPTIEMSFLNYNDCLHVNTIYSFWIQFILLTKVFLWVLWQYLHECHSLHIQLGVLRKLSSAMMTFKPLKGRRNSGELITDLLVVEVEVWWLLWTTLINIEFWNEVKVLWNNNL